MTTHLMTVQQSLGQLDPLKTNQQVSINVTCFFYVRSFVVNTFTPLFLPGFQQLTIRCLHIQ